MSRPAPIFVLLAVIPLAGCTLYGKHPVTAFPDATGGAGFERSLWHDIKEQNWKDLEPHIASNFVCVTPTGRLDRAAALAEIESTRLLDYSIGDLTTEMNSDTFIVTYAITLHGSSASGGFPNHPQRRMAVWQRQKSGWVAIAHSVLGEEPH